MTLVLRLGIALKNSDHSSGKQNHEAEDQRCFLVMFAHGAPKRYRREEPGQANARGENTPCLTLHHLAKIDPGAF